MKEKVTEEKSAFVKVQGCSEDCGWIKTPLALDRDCCPLCGAEIKIITGQYTIKTTRTFFSKNVEYVAFTKRPIAKLGGLEPVSVAASSH